MATTSTLRRLDWSIRAARSGTGFLLAQIPLALTNIDASSLLPGWSRTHVLAHVARNAEALQRLLRWAATGAETPMYSSPEQRAQEIEATAQQSAEALRRDVEATARNLDSAMSQLPGPRWSSAVRTARGRLVPAHEIPWMRCREVWLHAVDLAAGAHISDIPADMIDALLDDACAAFGAREGAAAILLTPTDRDRTWAIGPGDHAEVIPGEAAAILSWLIGRSGPEALPVYPVWQPPAWL